LRTVSIVVPVYYNELNLPHLFPHLLGLADANPQYDFEYVFVDDGSGDNSFEILADLAKRDPRVCVVKLSRNFGSNAALLAGLHYVSGDCVAMIAADLQDPPELITTMLQRWEKGKKVVLAAREDREDPLLNKFLSSVFYWLFRRLAIREMPVKGCDFVLIDREMVSFTYVPMRLVSALGVVLALAGFAWAVVVILKKILSGVPVQGWASLMTVVLVVSGVQLLTLGIFGEYLWRNFEETRKRPSFVVDQLIGVEEADAE